MNEGVTKIADHSRIYILYNRLTFLQINNKTHWGDSLSIPFSFDFSLRFCLFQVQGGVSVYRVDFWVKIKIRLAFKQHYMSVVLNISKEKFFQTNC